MTNMSHLSNPLVTINQLFHRGNKSDQLPQEIQEAIRFYTARLTQAAGLLLRLPQNITAQANVLLFRYWIVEDLMKYEFSDVSAATLYLTAKISASPRSLRGITNVYTYLLSPSSMLCPLALKRDFTPTSDPESYYLSESAYLDNRIRILHLEGQILNALGFQTHVALPHPLAITYLQILDVFESDKMQVGQRLAQRTIAHLNAGLLNPQMIYLTHQPCQLATAAIFLAAREIEVPLPVCAWWEVFDCEREDLGFLAVALGSLEAVVSREEMRWGEKRGMISRADVQSEMANFGFKFLSSDPHYHPTDGKQVDNYDEEKEMAKLLDEKVASIPEEL